MKRLLGLTCIFWVVLNLQSVAQTLEEGKNFIYYERFASARDVFQKIWTTAPSNTEAAYWLGQAYLGLEQVSNAKQVYQTALQANGNAPLLLVGIGEIELHENKQTDAKSRFETAISLTKAKDIEVLHAVGRANVNVKQGDPSYALAKLQLATTLKGFKDATVYITIGDAYRKQLDGGNAIVSYKTALSMNPKLASAWHKEGQIYETQKNKEFFLPAFEQAIATDPNYGPVYYSLYVYWYFRDVAKAEDYLHKYISVIDEDPQNDYYSIDLKYASKQYSQAIAESDALITKVGVNVIKPRIYRLKAYSYKALSDYSNALASADEFFKKAGPDEIVPKDYELYADILAGIPGSETKAYSYYERSISLDTLAENRVACLQKAADLAKKLGDKPGIAYWLEKQFLIKKTPSNVDLYNLGVAYFDAGDKQFANYFKADSVFSVYTGRYPEQALGYYWRGRTGWSIDTTMAQGLANPHFEKFIDLATKGKDSLTLRSRVKIAYRYFIGYATIVKKDSKMAIEYCDKILALDPLDKEAAEFKKQLSAPKSSAGAQQKSPGVKQTAPKPSGAKSGGAKPKK
jgi:tetratricopeptide (TPR) repeat protein